MNTAEIVISKFGGQQKLADALGVRQSNVSYWSKSGSIPAKWHVKIIEASSSLAIPVTTGDLLATEETSEPEQKSAKLPPPKILKHGKLNIAGKEVPCAVLSNGKRVVFQREVVGLLTGNKKGGLIRYLSAENLQPYVPEKFKGKRIGEAVIEFPYGGSFAHGFEGTDLIDICDMYLKALEAERKEKRKFLQESQRDLAVQAQIIIRSFAKLGITAAIDDATGFDKEKGEYQKLLAQYIAEELQPWVKAFGENYYYQIYRLKGWDWSRFSQLKRNHPWEVANITNRIVYEKLPPGVLQKLRELSPANDSGNRPNRLYKHLANPGFVHLVKHLGHIESMLERGKDGEWEKTLYEIDTRFPSKRDPYFQTQLRLMDNDLHNFQSQ